MSIQSITATTFGFRFYVAPFVLIAASISMAGCSQSPTSSVATGSSGETRVIYQQKSSGAAGTKCTVVDGPNKGKSGTYTNEVTAVVA
jgi:hypothetical protein